MNTPHPYDLIIGLDRADKKADLCLIDTQTSDRSSTTIDTSPEALWQWLLQLREQHPQARVALCLEQPAGHLIGFLEAYDWISLYPVNPITLQKLREAFVTSRAKDDAKDAFYLAELLLCHADKLKLWAPEDSATAAIQQWVFHRRAVIDERTGRLVVVDNYEIAGAGIILAPISDEDSTLKEHIRRREALWRPSAIESKLRAASYRHRAKFVVITGESAAAGERVAHALEKELFLGNFKAYYLGISNVERGLDADLGAITEIDTEQVRRIGELARIMTDAGLIFITSLPGIDEHDLRTLELLNQPHEILVVNVGENRFDSYTPHLVLPENIKDAIAAAGKQLFFSQGEFKPGETRDMFDISYRYIHSDRSEKI